MGKQTEKKKVVYSEKYAKHVTFNENGRKDLIQYIKDAEQIFAVEAGKYSDGKEYQIIKIDGI